MTPPGKSLAMNLRSCLCSLTLLVLALSCGPAAESGPETDPAAQSDAAPDTAGPAIEGAPASVAETVAEEPAPAPLEEAPPAPAAGRDQEGPWQFTLGGSLGFDSNVTLESTELDLASDEDSAYVAADGSVRYRHRIDTWRLGARLSASYTHYDDIDDFDRLQLSLLGSAIHTADGRNLHSLLGGYTFIGVDGEDAAHAINGGYRFSHVLRRWVFFAAADLQLVDYPDNDPVSGTRLDARLGSWYILDAGQPRRRAEIELRQSHYGADADAETYLATRLRARLRYRWQPGGHPCDLLLGAQGEYRDYDEGNPTAERASEHRMTLRAEVEAEYRCTERLVLGGQLAASDRDSNYDENVYDRLVIGTSLRYEW